MLENKILSAAVKVFLTSQTCETCTRLYFVHATALPWLCHFSDWQIWLFQAMAHWRISPGLLVGFSFWGQYVAASSQRCSTSDGQPHKYPTCKNSSTVGLNFLPAIWVMSFWLMHSFFQVNGELHDTVSLGHFVISKWINRWALSA